VGDTVGGIWGADSEPTRTIDCDECAMDGTAACRDCVVTFIIGRRPGAGVVLDAAEEREVGLLAHAGLVPALRYSSRAG